MTNTTHNSEGRTTLEGTFGLGRSSVKGLKSNSPETFGAINDSGFSFKAENIESSQILAEKSTPRPMPLEPKKIITQFRHLYGQEVYEKNIMNAFDILFESGYQYKYNNAIFKPEEMDSAIDIYKMTDRLGSMSNLSENSNN